MLVSSSQQYCNLPENKGYILNSLGLPTFANFFVSHILLSFGLDVLLIEIIFFPHLHYFIFFSFIFISWRLITLQYCSGFCHTLTWISHGFTCVPHPDPPSRLPPHPIPLGLPSAPAPSTCLMHPTWAGEIIFYQGSLILCLKSVLVSFGW